jgi:ATP-dependent helicase/nuclease subunit A
LLADRSDALSLAAVLRSPLVGLSDAALFRLSEKGRLEAGVLEEPLPLGFPKEEGERLQQFAAFFRSVSALLPPLPLAGVLEAVWQQTGYRAAVAAGPEAEESLSALERLLSLARAWDARGRGDVGSFARRLHRLAEQTVVGGATGVEQARTKGAVQLLSIHGAKGLEWPVVCLADLGTTGVRTPSDRLLLDRGLGLAFKPQGPFDAEPRKTPRWLLVQAELKRRERAEAGRLLYVALTRAQDRLVLSGGGSSPEGWRNRLEPALASPDVAPFVQRPELEEIPEEFPRALAKEEVVEAEAARAALQRIRAPLRPSFDGVPLEVAALEDFYRCPRRHWLLHQVGLLPEPGEGGVSCGDFPVRHVAARGALLASLAARLSTAEWASGAADAALVPHLSVLGLSLGEARALGLLAPLRSFAGTAAMGRALASGALTLGEGFALNLGPAVLLSKATLFWAEAGTLHLVVLVPGSPPPAGLLAFSVTVSALWHAAAVSSTAPLRVGLSFVDGPDAEPRWAESAPLSPVELVHEVRAMLQAGSGLPVSRPLEVCEALGCTFSPRCHPQAAHPESGAPPA